MRLSWNEVRVCAAGFAQEWWNTVRESSETQSLELHDLDERSVEDLIEACRKVAGKISALTL